MANWLVLTLKAIMGAVSFNVHQITYLSTTRKWNTTSFSARRRAVEINVPLPVIVVLSATTLKLHDKNERKFWSKQVNYVIVAILITHNLQCTCIYSHVDQITIFLQSRAALKLGLISISIEVLHCNNHVAWQEKRKYFA